VEDGVGGGGRKLKDDQLLWARVPLLHRALHGNSVALGAKRLRLHQLFSLLCFLAIQLDVYFPGAVRKLSCVLGSRCVTLLTCMELRVT
jgi:hypothetical protein